MIFILSCSTLKNRNVNLYLDIYILLGLHLGQLVALLVHLHDSVLLLLLHAGGGGLTHDVSLLDILPQLGDLGIALLVQLNLSLRKSL